MSDPKYVSRFPPCPLYDVEGMESWLEDLARKGLILTKGGLFCGFAEFEQTDPKPMRYRLQPLPKKKFMEDAAPTAAAVELAEEYGWTYLCVMGEFAVYGCGDPNARELDTDPQIQAISYRQLYRRKRNSIISHCVLFILLIGLILWAGPLTYFLEHPMWYTGLMSLIWLTYPFVTLQEMKQLKVLKEKLTLGEPLSRRKDWKRNRHWHRVSAILSIVLLLSFYTVLILENFIAWEDSRWQPVSEFQEERPFPTMEELAGGGTFTGRDWYVTKNNNMIAVRTTILAESQMHFEQYGKVEQNGSTVVDGTLLVDYYDLRTDRLAKALYNEILQTAKRSNGTYDAYQPLDTPELPVEQAAYYATRFPYLLLQNGSEVLKLRFIQYDQENAISTDQWAAVAAEALVQ